MLSPPPCHRASPGAEDAPVCSAVTADKPRSHDGFVLALIAAASLPHTCNELGGLSLAPPPFPRGRERDRGGIAASGRDQGFGAEGRDRQRPGSTHGCWEHPSLHNLGQPWLRFVGQERGWGTAEVRVF